MKRSKFLDHVREVIRTNHFSYSTEKTYVSWIYRFITFHDKRHPNEMAGKEIADFLTNLAVERKVSASTQNQALNALVFLYKKVLKIPLDNFDFKNARIGKRLPVVLSRDETHKVISNLQGEFYPHVRKTTSLKGVDIRTNKLFFEYTSIFLNSWH